MRTRLSRFPLRTQFIGLLALIALLGAVMAFVLMGRAYVAAAQSRAETIANLVEDVGRLASQYSGGLWVKAEAGNLASIGDYLDTVPVFKQEDHPDGMEVALPVAPTLTAAMGAKAGLSETDMRMLASMAMGGFGQKNPALIQRELSQVTDRSGHSATFRMTSDNFLNANNAPDRFDLVAIETMRAQASNDVTEVSGNRLRYARRIPVTPGCMKCHDTPEKAPVAVRTRYPDRRHGYGYRVGDVAGIISVSVPVVEAHDDLLKQVGGLAWAAIGAFVASLVLLMWFVTVKLIAPLNWLTAVATRASEGDLESPGRAIDDRIGAAEEQSRNEVDQLGVAFKRLLRSLLLTAGRR